MTSKAKPVSYPTLTYLPDPPEEDRMEQLPHMASAALTLRAYFRHVLGRSDVLVSGDGYLCRRAGEARRSPRPDCVVALNLPFDPDIIEAANGYTVEEVGQPADFVLEVGSKTTGRRDYTVKRDLYAGLEVREYWRFDHTGGGYHDVPLAGDLLVDGRYEPIPVELGADGVHRGFSAALGLELHWEGGQLRFYDPVAGEYLPSFQEAWTERDRAWTERDRALAERDRALTELDRSQGRLRELEEEIRRLRGQ